MGALTALQDLALPLLPHAQLRDIRLFRLEVQHLAFGQPADVQIDNLALSLQATSMGADPMEGMAFVLQVDAELVSATAESSYEALASLSAAYGAIYLLDGKQAADPDEEQVRAFGVTVGAMAVWPYLRAALANGVRELGYGTMGLLPTLTHTDLFDLIASADEESDPDAGAPVE